jgi:hypothetical protein
MRHALVAIEAVLILALLGAAGRQHWVSHGVELGFIALALSLMPGHLSRALTLMGRAPTSILPLPFEAVALVGPIFFYPAPSWAMGLGLAVPFLLSWGTDAEPERTPLWTLESAGLLAVLVAAGSVVSDVMGDPTVPVLRILTFAIVLLEAVSPRRQRSDRDSLRRISASLALIGTSGWFTHFWLLPPVPRVLASIFVGIPASLNLASAWSIIDRLTARDRRRMAMRIVAPALMLALVLVVGEVSLRLIPNRYRELVVPRPDNAWHEAGGTYTYEGALLCRKEGYTNTFRWNKDGWHDTDHEHDKPRGTTRVVVLGDSYVEGIQVPLEDLYHKRLERTLVARTETPVEVIGLGCSGWGQGQELKCLQDHGLGYAPDLVIDEFLCGNDVRNNDDELENLANEQSIHATRARELFIDCVCARLIFCSFLFDKVDGVLRRVEGTQEPLDCDVYRAQPRVRPERWAVAWDRTEKLLLGMKSELAPRGTLFAVVIFTSPLEIEACNPGWEPLANGMDMQLPARRMLEICERNGIACLNLAPRFAKHPLEVRHGLHLKYDGHWSSSAHREGASETAKFLLDETDLWKRALDHAEH